TLVADAITMGVLVAGVSSGEGGVTTGGVLGFLLATPIVHMVHGNIGPGFGSMGLRALLPLLGLGMGAIAGAIAGGTEGSGNFDKFANGASGTVNGAVLGGLIAAGGCVLIDAAAFAYTKEPLDSHPASTLAPRRLYPTVTLGPTFGLRRDYASVGLAGGF